MISANSSEWSRRLRARSWNSSARSSPAKPRHSRSPALARSTVASRSSPDGVWISEISSSVAGFTTRTEPLSSIIDLLAEDRKSLPLQVDRDVLGFEVLLDALSAALATEAGVLDTPEGRRCVRDHPLVEAYHAGLEALAHPQGALEVAGVDVGDESVLGVVGGCDGSFFRIERGNRGHGTEDLLLQERCILGDAVEHGGTIEVAGPLELLGELASNAVCHVEAVGCGTGLADIAHLGDEGTIDGGVDVSVVEHEEGGVATELHRDPQDLLGGLFDQLSPNLRRACERELACPRVGDKWAHRAAGGGARHHVQDAAGQSRLLQDTGEREHGQWRLLGWFGDHRAPGRYGWSYLAGAHRHREVPRRYEETRADGLLHGEHAPGACGRDRVAALYANGLL